MADSQHRLPVPGAWACNARNSFWYLLPLIAVCLLCLPLYAEAVVVNPASGPVYGGTAVTITGSGFVSDPVTEVYIGGELATDLVVVNSTTLTVTTPEMYGAGPADVDIYFQSGNNDYTANAFTYEDVSITSVMPSSGPMSGGTTVTVTGNHFTAPTTVAFAGTPGTSVNIIDSQTLSVVTPPEQSGTPGPVDVEIDVANGIGYAFLSNGFSYVQPTVTDITPASGPIYGGTPITVKGSGFSAVGSAVVTIGAIPAISTTILSDSVITAITPEGYRPGLVDVDIQFDSGSSGEVYLTGGFTQQNISVTSVTPAQGPVSGGTRLLIEGSLFRSPMDVTIGGNLATDIQVLDENTLMATTPMGITPASVGVSVGVTDTSAYVDLVGAFTYTDSGPFSVAPATGSTLGGTYVEISGSNAPYTATVLFGGVPAGNVAVVDSNTLSAISPPNPAGTVTITVDDGYDTYILANAFTYVAPPPRVDGIMPPTGLAAGGSDVTITGLDFQSGLSATIGGQSLNALAVLDSMTVTGTAPALPLGPADVVVINPDGQSAALVGGFNVVPELPQVSQVAGDVAPYGAPDGALNAGDLVVLQQFATGLKVPDAAAIVAGDVAPLNSPNGVIDTGDVLVLTRALLNQITLTPISAGSGTPEVGNVVAVSGQNPYTVTGTSAPNTVVGIFVNTVLQQQVTSDAGGTFTANVILADGQNNIYASADDGSGSILTTNHVQLVYENSIDRNQSGNITVDTAWTAGTPPQPYRITSDLVVAAGIRLILQPGVVLEFDDNTGLIVNGELQVSGQPDQPVLFTSSNRTNPVKGIWSGIQFGTSAAGSVIDRAIIEWAVNGVNATSASNLVVRNNSITGFSNSGIRVSNGSTASISANVIDNSDKTGSGVIVDQSSVSIDGNTILKNYYGIDILAASPLVQGNIVQENVVGIHIRGDNADPLVSDNVLVANTDYGVQISGTGQDLTNPQPVINGNNLYDNGAAEIYVTGYGSGSTIVLDLTSNWWGDAAPVLGTQVVVNTGDTPNSVADFSNPEASITAGPVITGLMVSEQYISPDNSPGIKDSSTITATLSEASNWTVSVSGGSGTVRSFSGSGTSIAVNWDGRDDSAVLLADGRYFISVSATSTGSGLIAAGNHDFTITVDNTMPDANIDFAFENAAFQNVLNVPVSGRASDTNPLSYQLEYGAGTAPASWAFIASAQNTVVSSGILADWTIVDSGGIQVPNGIYALRLSVYDAAGNNSSDTVVLGIFSSLIYDVALVDTPTIHPASGETASISFSVLLPSTTVTYTISDERTQQVVRTIEQTYGASTGNTLAWDGKDDAGNYVPDEAYVYKLTAANGAELRDYTPIGVPYGGAGISGNAAVNFDPLRNEFWKNEVSVNVAGLSRITLCISRPSATGTCSLPPDGFKPIDGVPIESGTQWVYWNGYDSDGAPLTTSTYGFYFQTPVPLPTNTILVNGAAPFISGENAAPNIEVKSNPYIVTHSYEEQTQIRFQLDQDSVVTVKLLPPGIYDPDDPSARTLIDAATLLAESSPGVPDTHTAIWKGYDDSVAVPDTNNILFATEGTYTFTIEATGVITGSTTLYRGAVTLYH